MSFKQSTQEGLQKQLEDMNFNQDENEEFRFNNDDYTDPDFVEPTYDEKGETPYEEMSDEK